MAEEVRLVEAFLAAAEQRDRALMARLFPPDAEVREPDSLPWGGVHRGLEGFLQLVRTLYGAFAWLEVKVEGMMGRDGRVVVWAVIEGRTRGGRTFSMPVLEDWRIEGGRIRAVIPHYFDTAAMARLAADQ
ncbi:MAG: hypothetical protein KatS3mg124_0217 [Porticoccaceae bacterium]|nr:MAG: hypothetical protein KatS3mg124_0217 [Porticoccaceae bacterium]